MEFALEGKIGFIAKATLGITRHSVQVRFKRWEIPTTVYEINHQDTRLKVDAHQQQ